MRPWKLGKTWIEYFLYGHWTRPDSVHEIPIARTEERRIDLDFGFADDVHDLLFSASHHRIC